MALGETPTSPHDSSEEPPGFTRLSRPEQSLVEALIRGQFCDLRDIVLPSGGHGDHVPVRAAVIRAIISGRVIPHQDADPHGLCLIGAVLDDRLDLDDITVPYPLRFVNCEFPAGISANRATLTFLHFRDSVLTIHGEKMAAVDLDQALVLHDCVLERCTIQVASSIGGIRLFGAHIGGHVNFEGMFTNTEGPALLADNLTTDNNLTLAGTYEGCGDTGAVRLAGAHIGGELQCTATITHRGAGDKSGPALGADALTVGSSMFLHGTHTAEGLLGAVRLLGAHIGGQMVSDTVIANPSGPALDADTLTAGDIMILKGTYESLGDDGAVRLAGAHIGGQFRCTATITSPIGPTLVADGIVTAGDIIVRGTHEGAGPLGAIRLQEARCGGQLLLEPRFPGDVVPPGWLVLDGITYQGVPHTTLGDKDPVKAWIELLAHQTLAYAAQPWQYLASQWRAAGHDGEARRILIAQQDDRRDRVVPYAPHPRWRRAVSGLSRLLTGYGYQSWRSLIVLSVLVVVSMLLSIGFGPVSCGLTARAQTGLAWAVPIIFSGIDTTCTPTHLWLTIGSWLIHVAGWVFVTLFVTGFTGIIRKSHD